MAYGTKMHNFAELQLGLDASIFLSTLVPAKLTTIYHLPVVQSDQFQSLVGSVAALCNGAGRLFWGNMLDAVPFKPLFASLAVVQVKEIDQSRHVTLV